MDDRAVDEFSVAGVHGVAFLFAGWIAADGTAAARRLLPLWGNFELGQELLFLLELGEFRFPVLALPGILGGKGCRAVLERDGLDAGGGEHVDVVEHRPEP